MHLQTYSSSDIDKLLKSIELNFGSTDLTLSDEYSYSCLPLCIIDSIFSIQAKYSVTQAVVRRWVTRTDWPLFRKQGEEEHTVSEFIAIASRVDCDSLARDWFGNRQRTSSKNGILKAEAVVHFASCLASEGIERFCDTSDTTRMGRVENCVRKIKGQASGITWKYFLMLSGDENSIKPDTWVCRYVARVIGRRDISAVNAEAILLAAIDRMKVKNPSITPRQIDHAIWQLERQRG